MAENLPIKIRDRIACEREHSAAVHLVQPDLREWIVDRRILFVKFMLPLDSPASAEEIMAIFQERPA